MIFFVGDKPSKQNKDPGIAFVGTKSYKVLMDWIVKMDISVTDVVLVNKDQVKPYNFPGAWEFTTKTFSGDINPEYGDVVIALGNKASEYLSSIELSHFKLPHPSGRNRKINDKQWLNKELKQCKEWLNESTR